MSPYPALVAWASRCHRCGWISPAYPAPQLTPDTCPRCAKEESR